VINKKYLSEEEVEILDSKPIELELWDPMGTLAN
jgi:aminopeptidase C